MQPRFMTGVYGRFQPELVLKETRPGFAGLEISSLGSLNEVIEVAAFAREHHLVLGAHFPLVRSTHPGCALHPLVTSRDAAMREQAFSALASELQVLERLAVKYLVVHFPKPSLLCSSLDWSDWRFPQEGESLLAEETGTAEQRQLALMAFSELDQLAAQTSVRIVLEHDILHSVFYQSLFGELLAEFPRVGFCLDTGRLHLQQHTDPGFSAISFIEQMKPYITNLHLWTVRLGENRQGGHHPILPSLSKEEGWGDNESYLRALSTLTEGYVMFEHRSDLVSETELDLCYSWTEELLTGRSCL